MDMSLSTDASSSSSSTHPVQGSSSSAAFASPSVLGKKRLHADETEETEKSLSKREKCDPVSTTSSSSTTNSTATTPAVTTTSSSSLSASTEETKNTNNNRVTENGVTRIIHREKDLRPILYLVQVQDSQDKKRKQGLISDGHLCIEFYTAEILKKEFEKQQLNVYSVVQLKNFLYNPKDSLKKVYIQTIGFISGPTALSGPVSVVNVSEAEGKLVVRPGRLFPLPAFPTASPSSGSSSSSFSAASLGLSAFASSSFASSSSSSSAASTKRTAPPIKQEQKSKQLTLPSEASPISSLHTGRTSFMIKAWVDSLSEPKTFNTNGRPGMLAKVILRDESGRISATLWNDDVNRFAAMLKLDHCYYFSFVSGSVKNVNAKFRGTVQCDYELSMNSQTVVQPVVEEEKETKKHKLEFQFVPIATLSTLMERASVLNIPAYVDLLGVVTAEPGTPIQFKAKKTGKDVTKQTLTLIDRSKSSVDITFFHGRPLGLHVGDIVAFKKVKMTSYSGVSLTFSDESRLYINSGDVAGTPELRKWYNHHKQGLNEAASLTTRQKTERKNTLGEMDTLDFDFKESTRSDAQYIEVRATLAQVIGAVSETSETGERTNERRATYPGCPFCKKKCEPYAQTCSGVKCIKENKTFPSPTFYFIVKFLLVDAFGQRWATAFDSTASVLFGMSGNEYENLPHESKQQVLQSGCGVQGLFKLKVDKDKTKNEDYAIKVDIQDMRPVPFKNECELLLERIKALSLLPQTF